VSICRALRCILRAWFDLWIVERRSPADRVAVVGLLVTIGVLGGVALQT
jgi:hypothetical protein